MNQREDSLQKRIIALKEKRKAVILAHTYQIGPIQECADFTGDSLELAKKSKELTSGLLVFCGVKFMAETAKILSPEKKVLLPVQEAGCPLADTITPEQLRTLKREHPNAWVVSYVNTPATIKALSDVCCTSSNAVSVVRNVPTQEVIFVPDKNLGWWVQKNVPEKKLIIWPGSCFVHEQFTLAELHAAKRRRPEACVLAHPECNKEVLEHSDFVLSTSGMLKAVQQSKTKVFIIGTEEGLLYRLKKDNPDKEFYSMGMAKTCLNMKMTTLESLYDSLENLQFEINLDAEIAQRAQSAIERMVQYV